MTEKQPWLILATGLALMAGTGAYLGTQGASQKIGPPGVRIVHVPIEGEETSTNGTKRRFVAAPHSVFLPAEVLNYKSETFPVAKVVLDWLPKDTTYGQRMYTATNDHFKISTMVVLMGRDRTSIHQPEYCLMGSGWQITERGRDRVFVERPVPYELPVSKLLTLRRERTATGEPVAMRGIFLYWFVADNQLAADHFQRMGRLAWDMMRTGTLQRWAYISCFSVCPPGAEEATLARMKLFIAAAVPEFQLVPAAPELRQTQTVQSAAQR
jgi:hypothetical protein